jgi:TolB-like protein
MITHRIVSDRAGSIVVSSRPGERACFSFACPPRPGNVRVRPVPLDAQHAITDNCRAPNLGVIARRIEQLQCGCRRSCVLENSVLHIAKISLISALLCALLMPAIASAKDAVKIAILPIVVHSADDPTFLRQGLADMIASRVDQLGVFDVTRVDDLETATTSLEKAVETGRSGEVDFVLFGSFTRFGTGASLDMQCVSTRMDFEGDPLREIFVHSGSIGEVIPDLDDLVGKIGRFAIHGFAAKNDQASGPPADGTSQQQTDSDLAARVEALEKALAELQSIASAASKVVEVAQP